MNDIFLGIIFIEFALIIFPFGIAIYMNIWIYYCEDEDRFPYFPFLNPFSYSSYELMLNSMFKMNWEVENENKKLKRKSNKLRKFSGKMLLVIIGTGILSLVLKYFQIAP